MTMLVGLNGFNNSDTHLLHLGQLPARVLIVPQVFLVANQDDRDVGAEMLHFRRPFFWYVFYKQIRNSSHADPLAALAQMYSSVLRGQRLPFAMRDGYWRTVELAVRRRWHGELELRGLLLAWPHQKTVGTSPGHRVPQREISFCESDMKNSPGNVVN